MKKILFVFVCFIIFPSYSICDTTDVTNNITSDTTWLLLRSPYRVKNEIIISNGATLTIEAGVVVLFDSGAGIRVGMSGNSSSDIGSMNAFGFEGSPVVFTALNSFKRSWKGLVFDNGSDNGTNSLLRYCVIEYGGQKNIYNASANLYCNSTISPTLDYCTIQNAAGNEIYLKNSSPIILHSTVTHSDTGITAFLCVQNSAPAISNTTLISDSTAYILYTDSTSHPTLTSNSFFSFIAKSCRVGVLSEFTTNSFVNVYQKGIEFWGGTININRIWTKQFGDSLFQIYGSDIVIENNIAVTLTVSAGLKIQFSECGMRIGGNATTERGKLLAIGEMNDSILFTNVPNAQWRGLVFDNGSDVTVSSSLKFCRIENAALNNFYSVISNIYCTKTNTPAIDSSLICNSGNFEIYTNNSSPTITNSIIRSNNKNKSQSAITVRNESGIVLAGNYFESDSTIYIVYSDSSSFPDFQNNIFKSVNAKPLHMGVLSRFTGNDFSLVTKKGIEIFGGTLNTQRQWSHQHSDSLYIIVGKDIQIIGATAVLTLDAGIILKFLNVGIKVGGSTSGSNARGSLNATGTQQQPVIFTSYSGGIGGWKGIVFDNGSDFNISSTLAHCVISNAGLPNSYSINSNIYCRNTNTPTITFSKIHSSAAHGIYTVTSSPVIQNSKIYNNVQSGIYVGNSSSPVLASSKNFSNTIYGNGTFDIVMGGTLNVNAQYNYWGTLDTTQISAHIFDKADNSALGKVFYQPYTDSTFTLLLPDTLAPHNADSALSWSDSGKALQLISNRWYNYASPFFVWNSSRDTGSGVSGYSVIFTTNSNGIPDTAISSTDTFYTVSQVLHSDSTYFLRMRSRDNLGNWSASVTLFIYKYDAVAPTPPQLLSATAGFQKISLQWKKHSEITLQKYRIFADTLPLPVKLIDSTLSRSDTTKFILNLINDQLYYFRINAIDSAHNVSNYSHEISAMPLNVPSPPKLFFPDSASIGISVSPLIAWKYSAAVVAYHLQLSRDSLFTQLIVNDSLLTDTSKQITNLLNNTKYYWRVRAKNDGGIGNWSVIWYFRTVTIPFFVADSTTASFDSVLIGENKKDSIVITNSGSATLHFNSIVSDNAQFSVTINIDSLLPSAFRKIYLQFQPADSGLQQGKLIFSHSALSSPDTVAMSGIGVLPRPLFSLNVASRNFSNVVVDSIRKDSIVVFNTGTDTLQIFNIISDNTAFAISDTTGIVPPFAHKKYYITFQPHITGGQSGNFTFLHNANGSPDSLPVTGNGVTPLLQFGTTTLLFDSVNIATSKKDSVLVSNSGTATLIISAITSSNTAFNVSPTNFSLLPGLSRYVKITFLPQVAQQYISSVVFFHNSKSNPDTLTATGNGVAPQIQISDASVSFGFVHVNTVKQETLTVKNTGTANLEITNITSTLSPYQASPTNFTLAPSDSQKVTVTFLPINNIVYNGTLRIFHNAAGGLTPLNLFGTGAAPTIVYSPKNISYGNVILNQIKLDSFTISNSGNADLSVSNFVSSSAAFVVDTGSFLLQPNVSKIIHIAFSPDTLIFYAHKISFTHNALDTSRTVTVAGRGIAAPTPIIVVTRNTLTFPNTNLGLSSLDSFVVRNTGGDTLKGNLHSSSSLFSVSANNISLPPGMRQTVRVAFIPDTIGTYVEKIKLTHNAPGDSTVINLNGVGVPVPILIFPQQTIFFDTILVGTVKQDSFLLKNIGTAPLVINSLTSSNDAFAVQNEMLIVAPADSHFLRFTFTPSQQRNYSGTITVNHNAGHPVLINANGKGKQKITDEIQTTIGQYAAGIPDSHWILMSIPYDLDFRSTDVLRTQLAGENAWKMYTYENGQFIDISYSQVAFRLTRAFWFKTVAISNSFNLNFGAGNLNGEQSDSITIPKGWSLVGSPFYPQNTVWISDSSAGGSIGVRVWKWNYTGKKWEGPIYPWQEQMQPFGGYAVYNGTASSTTFTFLRNTTITPSKEWNTHDGWYATIEAGNASLRIGQHKKARNKKDVYDYPSVMTHPDAQSDDAYLSGKLWSDIRAFDDSQSVRWKIYINPRTTHSIQLKELFGLPNDWKIVVSGIPLVKGRELRERETILISQSISVPFVAEILVGKSELLENEKPKEFSLQQNYPNPFNPSTAISVQLSAFSNVTLKIYDVLGREVATLFSGELQSGKYNFIWEGKDNSRNVVGSGIYFARLTTKDFTKTIKMELLK